MTNVSNLNATGLSISLKLKNIHDGWKNLLIPTPEVEKLAAKRLAVCGLCPHKTPLTCGLCGCPLNAKSRAVNDSCPAGRWAR